MIILEKPYTSAELAEYIETSGVAVLDTAEARAAGKNRKFNLLRDDEFAQSVDAGGRLYTSSENALDWVGSHIHDRHLLRAVESMKDKAKLREALSPLYPGYYFRVVAAEDLPHIVPSTLPLPLVLKPVVGFFSVGVFVINTVEDWLAALSEIRARREAWRREYPDSVVGNGRFILEQYITGDEYAIDAYYDNDGKAVVVNILHHEFSSAEDVSDRLYVTSAEIIREHCGRFTRYLDQVNEILGVRNFPMHVEVRLGSDCIIPIEFNPLRFAGWCTTDIAWFAYGIHTYGLYLENARPDWDALLAGKEDSLFSLVLLDKPVGTPETAQMDFDKLRADFTEILSIRPVDFPGSPLFAFLFVKTPTERRGELDRILRSNLGEYIQA